MTVVIENNKPIVVEVTEEEVTVTATGSRGPQGEDGPQGDQGPQGDPGPQGEPGEVTQDELDDTTEALQDYVRSRGQNLVTNGYGSLGDNTNFDSVGDYVTDDVYVGAGAFERTSSATARFMDELVAVEPGRVYAFRSAHKLMSGPSVNHYQAVRCVDVDGNRVSAVQVMKYPGSTYTSLAQELTAGDSQIVLADATGWYDGSTNHARNMGFWPYTNAQGYTYPDYTYTRNLTWGGTGDIEDGFDANEAAGGTSSGWPEGGITGNVITLHSTYTGPTLPVGTKVANMQSGGTFYYPIGAQATPSEWTSYEGLFGGSQFAIPPQEGDIVGSNTGIGNNDHVQTERGFRWGTAQVELGFLLNYSSTATSRVSAVSFGETLDLAADFDFTGTIAVPTPSAAGQALQTTTDWDDTTGHQGVPENDTGWRDISADLQSSAAFTVSEFYIRRIGNTVLCQTDCNSSGVGNVIQVTAGFAISSRIGAARIAAGTGTVSVFPSSGWIQTVSGQVIGPDTMFSYPTDDPWPASLPGIAA